MPVLARDTADGLLPIDPNPMRVQREHMVHIVMDVDTFDDIRDESVFTNLGHVMLGVLPTAGRSGDPRRSSLRSELE